MGSCDNRCTSGQEGTCRCSCGGENHGTAKATYDAIQSGRQATIKGAGIDLVLIRGEKGEIAAASKDGVAVGGFKTEEEFVKNLGELIRAGRVEVKAGEKVVVSPKLTAKEAMAQIRAIGASVTRKDGEYKVNIPGGTEATAYYTDDPRDAVGTAKAMMAQYVKTIPRETVKGSGGNFSVARVGTKGENVDVNVPSDYKHSTTNPFGASRTLTVNLSGQGDRAEVKETRDFPGYKFRTDLFGPNNEYMGFHISKKRPTINNG